jgi:chlorobactene glucosyltransferase
VPSVAIGQFLFFSAEAYRSIGGHEAVKARILEDVWLGREVARCRYKQLTLDLSPLVSCQMYRGFRPMWNGIARWLYSIASMSAAMLVLVMVVVVLLFLMPFLWLAYGLFLAQPAFGWEVLVALQVAILYVARFLAGQRFSQPASSAILHPLGIALLLLVGLHAGLRQLRGSGVEWKGRVYDARSRIA